MRLLFSSAQIEYLRYWLHTMQLTKAPIPLPSSDYLIQQKDLVNHSPDVYSDASVLKRAIKVRRARHRGGSRRRGRRGGQRGRRRTGSSTDTDATPNGALQMIDKNNKKLKKGMDSMLGLRRLLFERVRTLWAARLGTWCAMDFEAWDRDHTLLTEFGWRLVQWVDEQPVKEHGHLIVNERRQYTQHYVPDNRDVRDRLEDFTPVRSADVRV